MVRVNRHRFLLVVVVVLLCLYMHSPCIHTHKDTQYCTKYIFKVNVSQYDIKREEKPATIELPIWPIYIFAVLCVSYVVQRFKMIPFT